MGSSTTDPGASGSPAIGPRGLLAVSAWLGLASGLLEVASRVASTSVGRSGRLYQLSRHFVWLVPVTDLLIFLALGAGLALIVPVAPRFGRRLGLRGLVALALLPALMVAVPGIYAAAWLALGWGVAAWAVPFAEARPAGTRRVVAWGLPLLAGAVVLLAGSVFGGDRAKRSRESARPLPPAGSPNVLLIVLDTVRADRLSAYGYPRRTTPALDMLAARGVRFDAARSTSPWTLPAHGSLLTGRLPRELNADWLAPLTIDGPTLAGYLGSKGYATSGFVANTLYCSAETGLGEGFTHYEDYDLPQLDAFLTAKLAERALVGFFQASAWLGGRYGPGALAPVESFVRTYVYSGQRKNAEDVNREFLTWLARRPRPDRPFFAFLNYYDTHDPYLPPRPESLRFGPLPSSPNDLAVLQNWEAVDKPALDDRSRALASDCYDGCLAYLDEQLFTLLTLLEKQGVMKDTLVVVTADHGESFGEHGLFVHGDSLYRPEIRVPLIVAPPMSSPAKPARGVVGETVSLVDLPSTLVDLLGFAAGSPIPGRSFAGSWASTDAGPADSPPRYARSELSSPNPTNPNQGRSPARLGRLTALSDGRFTYIAGGGKEELYDAKDDPGETRNLAGDASNAPVLQRFRAEAARGTKPRG